MRKIVTCPRCGREQDRWHTAIYCTSCEGMTTKMQSRASRLVSRAVQNGDLKKLDGSIPCVDCGKPARDYDHRDYAKPLDVDPVCRSCNSKRGTGANKFMDLAECEELKQASRALKGAV